MTTNRRLIGAAAFAVLLSLFQSADAAGIRPDQRNRNPRFRAPVLQNIDKVELLKVQKREPWEEGKVFKTLEGQEAQDLAALWRQQRFPRYSGSCFEPQFGIKFYLKGGIVLHTVVCFDCGTAMFYVPKDPYMIDFDLFRAPALKLKGVFLNAWRERADR